MKEIFGITAIVLGFYVLVFALNKPAHADARLFEPGDITLAYHACFDPARVADRMSAAAAQSNDGGARAKALWQEDVASGVCVILPPWTEVTLLFHFAEVYVRDRPPGFYAEAWAFEHPSFGQTMYGAWRE